jgi:hypothetical protein
MEVESSRIYLIVTCYLLAETGFVNAVKDAAVPDYSYLSLNCG